MADDRLFPAKDEIEYELKWREEVQLAPPTNANQRRINYLRERYKNEYSQTRTD